MDDLFEQEIAYRDYTKKATKNKIDSFNEALKIIEQIQVAFAVPKKPEIKKEQAIIKKMQNATYFENLFYKKEIKNEFRRNRSSNRGKSR